MMRIDVPTMLDDPLGFRDALTRWFRRDARDYPWRRTTDPYAVLVSELMLQQTTLAMVLERRHYERWMTAFPDVVSLAAASESQVLALWEGLGYYNRARHLHRAARLIAERPGAEFPDTLAGLLALPGVGRYTAGAVLSFAFDRPAPLVDGNVARVFSRLMNYRESVDSAAGQRQLWNWAEALLPARDVRHYNAALMELGQRICLPGQPTCPLCPVRGWCRAGNPACLPVKNPRRATVRVVEDVLLARWRGQWLLQQESGRRRKGLWKLPEVDGRPCGPLRWEGRYSITHYRVTLRVFAAVGPPVPRVNEIWIPEAQMAVLPMPSPFRRAVAALLDPGVQDDG